MPSSKPDNHKYLKNILKKDLIDLHIHIGGAMSPHTLWEIAHSQGIKLPVKDYWEFCHFLSDIDDLRDYLRVYELTEKIQSSPKAIERGIYNVISKEYRSSNVSQIELRFNPLFRTRGGEIDMDHIIHAAIRGMDRAMLDYDVIAGLIFILDRRLEYKLNRIIVEKAIKYRSKGVVGLDIAGPEDLHYKTAEEFEEYKQRFKKDVGVEVADPKLLNFETGKHSEKYVALFQKARKYGLGITVHTGEQRNTKGERVIQVIKAIQPDRIGHGIRAAYNQEAIQLLKENGTVLEICPSVNVSTGSVKDWEEMKFIIQTFLKNKVKFTINTDGPYLAQTGLAKEYRLLEEKGILTKEQLLDCLDTAREASFIKHRDPVK